MKRSHIILLLLLLGGIVWSAINPATQGNWWLEITPVFIVTGVLIFLGREFTIPLFVYILLLIFSILPIMQAHYGVANVPFGDTLAEWFNRPRNSFDRLTHLASGLLWTPYLFLVFKQMFRRFFAPYFITVLVIMAFSAGYEILEWASYKISGPTLGSKFVGAQGDLWDPSKDMALATLGVIISLLVIFFIQKITAKKALKN